MRTIWLIIFCSISLLGCSILSGEKNEPQLLPCQMEVDINGQPWSGSYPEDKVDHFYSKSLIHKYTDGSDGSTQTLLHVTCEKRYSSDYIEYLRVVFKLKDDTSINTIIPQRINLLNAEQIMLDRFVFTESDYDAIIGDYARFDSTETAYAEITSVDAENMTVSGTFEGTLIVREDQMDNPAAGSDIRRRADTLRFTNGSFTVGFKDNREGSESE
jgi:hypothetical protein